MNGKKRVLKCMNAIAKWANKRITWTLDNNSMDRCFKSNLLCFTCVEFKWNMFHIESRKENCETNNGERLCFHFKYNDPESLIRLKWHRLKKTCVSDVEKNGLSSIERKRRYSARSVQTVNSTGVCWIAVKFYHFQDKTILEGLWIGLFWLWFRWVDTNDSWNHENSRFFINAQWNCGFPCMKYPRCI